MLLKHTSLVVFQRFKKDITLFSIFVQLLNSEVIPKLDIVCNEQILARTNIVCIAKVMSTVSR